ncbi:MAG TPA: energy transducer TonB [Acidobacteriota bacterium]|jgi:protein TonB
MFESAILEGNLKTRSRQSTFLLSVVLHLAVIIALIVVPLVFIQPLPEIPPLLVPIILTPLPAPPPASSNAKAGAATKPKIAIEDSFVAPPRVPDRLPEPVPADVPDLSQLVSGDYSGPKGVTPGAGPGGPGGSNAVVVGAPPVVRLPPPPAPLPQRRAPIRVSSGAIAAKLIDRVDPIYPPLARQARVQGIVVLQILVDEQGNVREVTVISGHALLNQAAIDAVQQWRYTPTYLNGAPVAVKATITVNFVLR